MDGLEHFEFTKVLSVLIILRHGIIPFVAFFERKRRGGFREEALKTRNDVFDLFATSEDVIIIFEHENHFFLLKLKMNLKIYRN